MSRKLSDNELLHQYLDGEQSAISSLLERHKQRVKSYIYLMVRDKDRADDILQDVLIKAVRVIDSGKYVESGRFLSWLLRIAHNMTIDQFRSSKRHIVTNEAEAGYDILGAQRHIEAAVEDMMINEEREAQIRSLVTLLPEDQREVVQLRYYSDLSFREIADQTGVSINTALGRMRYALINLRKLIKDRELALV